MPTRTARTAWNGTLQEGSGQVELSSSRSAPSRCPCPSAPPTTPAGRTSPEELIAAAHASCFAMALSGEIARPAARRAWR